MADFSTWASIAGLSMTPNLILGPSTAIAVGVGAQIEPGLLLPVVASIAWAQGMLLAWLAGKSTRIGLIHRWIERLRTPRSLAFAQRWGVWGGLTLGCALVGQEPILIALRWLGIEMRRIALPLAISNGLFAMIFHTIAQFGLNQIAQL
jgi:hypothetical protein